MGIEYIESEVEVDKSKLVDAMIHSVHEAGDTALKHFTDNALARKHKNDRTRSLQTLADLETEATLEDSLKYHYDNQDFRFYSEESKEIPETFDTDIVFIADPIDGTTNFVNKNNFWGVVMSAYKTDDEGRINKPLASVIYHPKVEQLIWTSSEEDFPEKGKLFRMEGRGYEIKEWITQRTEPSEDTKKETELLDHKHITMTVSGEANDFYFPLQKMLYDYNVSMRNLGSTSISLGEVAGHGSHGMICLGKMNRWDVAAGMHLAEASGCTIIERTIKLPHREDMPLLIVAESQAIADELEITAINAIYYPETMLAPLETTEHINAMAYDRGCA